MKRIICDTCGAQQIGHEMAVTLKGIVGTSGGILLPEKFHEKHFCKPACFWAWVAKYNPSKSKT